MRLRPFSRVSAPILLPLDETPGDFPQFRPNPLSAERDSGRFAGFSPQSSFRGISHRAAGLRQKRPGSLLDSRASRSTAATYSPNWWVSTIGDGELNFSVRNGKRWFLTAIATAVYDLRERSLGRQSHGDPSPSSCQLRRKSLSRTYSLLQFHLRRIFPYKGKVSRAISTGRLSVSLRLHLLPIDVVVSDDPQGKSHLEDGFALRCFQRLS